MLDVQSLKDLGKGISTHPWKTAAYIFTAFSVLFTIIKGVTQFMPGVKIEGIYPLTLVLAVSVFYGFVKIWKPSKVEIKIAHTNTSIEVLFGDFFEQGGIRAVAVTEYFESKLGKPVSEKSLHGLFLKKCFGAQPESFDKQVDEQLKNTQGIEVPKTEGKTKCYPLGTTALIKVDQDRYLVFAFAKANPVDCKAYADVTMMWDSLHKLWQRARSESGGDPINLPLVGSGLSGLGLPTRDLLNLIILSAITETKANQISSKIRVVIHRDRFEELDLREVKKHWEE
jgi:hypothetical protein